MKKYKYQENGFTYHNYFGVMNLMGYVLVPFLLILGACLVALVSIKLAALMLPIGMAGIAFFWINQVAKYEEYK